MLYPLPEALTDPPRRRHAHHALVLNRDGAVLLVETTGSGGLVLPGGNAERHELPHLAARRHAETLTGLVLPLRTLLAADHVDGRLLPETVHFVHWGGRLSSAQETVVARHRPPQHVLGVHWIHAARLSDVMPPDDHRRLAQARAALSRGTHLPFLLRGSPAE
ncbi:NUDIX domain-containing protein [Kitasatospora sp. NBC_01560]|uniref:NUDIX domain-containing protein n=1 Tax=Kitasatospora sp. NBC_01560 TaxID=2975965 RepID=UPI003862F611